MSGAPLPLAGALREAASCRLSVRLCAVRPAWARREGGAGRPCPACDGVHGEAVARGGACLPGELTGRGPGAGVADAGLLRLPRVLEGHGVGGARRVRGGRAAEERRAHEVRLRRRPRAFPSTETFGSVFLNRRVSFTFSFKP